MKRLIQLLFLGALSLSSSLSAQISKSKWQAEPIVIDGDGSDWGSIPRFFNAESNIKYEFRNDAQNLYIILTAADVATQMQILKAGFSVKLKVKTSPPTKVGINFLPSNTDIIPSMINLEKLSEKSVTDPESVQKDTAIAEGFLFTKGKIISENTDQNAICFSRGKSRNDQGTYEMCIPLREIFGKDYTMETISSSPMQLQVVINDLSRSKTRGNGGGRRGMGGKRGMSGGEGGRGMSGGGMSGGGRGMGGGMGGGMPGGEGSEMPGGEPGGMPNEGRAQPDLQSKLLEGLTMDRKTFSIDFNLVTGK